MIEIPNCEAVKNLGWRRREAGMGGDIFIQIYTGVSTRPSTSRPLLAAYAVRRNAYEACGAPTCLYHGVCMHTWITIARKKNGRFRQLLKIISRADYLLAISHVCNRSTGNPEPTIPSLPTQILLWSSNDTNYPVPRHPLSEWRLLTLVIGQSMETSVALDHVECLPL